jgi:pimeloyl-ACP methyl ester carboxylesterase
MKVGISMKKAWIRNIGLAALVVSVFSFAGHQALTTKAQTAVGPVPVILVHGYNANTTCPGVDNAAYWRNTMVEMTLATRGNIPAADVVPVSYYQCDLNGVDIAGYGPGVTRPVVRATGETKPQAGFGSNAPITRISKDFAWFVYNEYSLKGRQVNIIGHSMGGLIAREALRRVQAGDVGMPPTLDVKKVLTVATPHNGLNFLCGNNVQCSDMKEGSTFLTKLQTNAAPQGSNGTEWWAMATAGEGVGSGSFASKCDFVPTDSAIAVGGTDLVYTKPCYSHTVYLGDRSYKLDAEGSPELGGRHSLDMMVHLMKWYP